MADLTMGVFLIYGLISLAVGIAIGVWKGRVFASILWSSFLGPLGWIVVALGPNMTPKTTGNCPHCAHLIPVNERFCKNCNSAVVWIQGKARKPSRAVA